ncbi:Hypothetical protein GSB_150490 [Giardia duodenalis]|uniref:Uncharacterized protein n=1 Tax=Giardia intestinalis TaxID=5741 RepID=V6TXA0_GIAIN|nr:Hypothetical protein GSB_150490 [Giardia intestinalis]
MVWGRAVEGFSVITRLSQCGHLCDYNPQLSRTELTRSAHIVQPAPRLSPADSYGPANMAARFSGGVARLQSRIARLLHSQALPGKTRECAALASLAAAGVFWPKPLSPTTQSYSINALSAHRPSKAPS